MGIRAKGARGLDQDLQAHAPRPIRATDCFREGRTGRRGAVQRLLLSIGLLLAFGVASPPSWSFDRAGFKSRLETNLAEFNAKDLKDSKATLARIDQMIAIGIVAMREYAAKEPKYAKLMEAAIADVEAMKGMTDVESEEKWGEKGTGGDAVGVPLKSLPEFGQTRGYLELVVSPSRQYIFVKKWESSKKARGHWLEEARDEAVELTKRLESIK
jgi:hypothetical protein